jgi:hypothetical protein
MRVLHGSALRDTGAKLTETLPRYLQFVVVESRNAQPITATRGLRRSLGVVRTIVVWWITVGWKWVEVG